MTLVFIQTAPAIGSRVGDAGFVQASHVPTKTERHEIKQNFATYSHVSEEKTEPLQWLKESNAMARSNTLFIILLRWERPLLQHHTPRKCNLQYHCLVGRGLPLGRPFLLDKRLRNPKPAGEPRDRPLPTSSPPKGSGDRSEVELGSGPACKISKIEQKKVLRELPCKVVLQ